MRTAIEIMNKWSKLFMQSNSALPFYFIDIQKTSWESPCKCDWTTMEYMLDILPKEDADDLFNWIENNSNGVKIYGDMKC